MTGSPRLVGMSFATSPVIDEFHSTRSHLQKGTQPVGTTFLLWDLLWPLLMLALLVLSLVSIIWLLRHMGRTTPTPAPTRDPALDELRRRYATGEIDQDEYRHRRDQLRDEQGR